MKVKNGEYKIKKIKELWVGEKEQRNCLWESNDQRNEKVIILHSFVSAVLLIEQFGPDFTHPQKKSNARYKFQL